MKQVQRLSGEVDRRGLDPNKVKVQALKSLLLLDAKTTTWQL